jgi:hypothetical protein
MAIIKRRDIAPPPSTTTRPTAGQTTQPQKPTPATSSSGWVKPAGGGRGSAIDSKQAKTAFWHSPYTNADAAAAKKAFGLKSIDEAKEFIGKAVITRNEGPLAQAGITRHRFDNHDCKVAFLRSPYTDADAKEAVKKLPFLKNVAEAKEYIGLKIVNKNEGILHEVGISRYQFDSHEQMAAFKRAGYSNADAEKAKKTFDFLKDAPIKEVKEYMGLKVINNYTEMLSNKGITPGRDRHEIP